LIPAFLAAEFIKPSHGLLPPEKVSAMLSDRRKCFLTLEMLPPHLGPWSSKTEAIRLVRGAGSSESAVTTCP
jgi:hypothetical protein